MTEAEALAHVKRMGIAAQKCRSNIMEMGDDMAAISETLTPWLFGDKNILRAIEIVQNRGSIAPGEFYNLMYVANRPEMRAMLGMYLAVTGAPELPEPDLQWIHGWEVPA